MLDLLSPLRGYIAQNLQFYLSKYIEDIQLEGLGLFGGDLVLNDLEIKRHVLRESLEIPSSFDFSRGFIRELRIHIPWTQLLSQPIEVKLYTIELILTGKSNTARAASLDASVEGETEIDQPKSGWIHDMLQRILANVSVQINNLVLKYTSDGVAKEDTRQNPVRRKVVGYEVPVLSRTSASIRAKLQLFPSAVVKGQGDQRSKPTSPTSPLHQQRPAANGVRGEGNIIDVDGLFAYRPSVTCDPFYYYSCNRSSVTPMYEVDVFIGELFFSVSDRQLEMLNQLIQSASRKIDQAHELHAQTRNCGYVQGGGIKIEPTVVPVFPAVVSLKDQMDAQKDGGSKKQESWFGWAMNALGATEDEEEDELVSELLAETRGALLKGQSQGSDTDEGILAPSGPVTKTSCVRVCISSASLTLRKHETETQPEHQDFAIAENGEEFVPVANLGMVKVVLQTKKKKVARPAVPILHLTLSYVALEMLLARGQEQSGTDLVIEVEKVELVSATTSENREDLKCKKGEVLLTWGSIDSSHFSDCVSHPYFINSFFGEETTRLNQRESRSFEIVKVSLDSGIPIWKTLDDGRGSRDSDENSDLPCDCFTTWNGESVRCIPITTISRICHHTIRMIGIKERVLDEGILSNAVSTAWASSGIPISVSEEMARTLTSTADEYRAHRNPDIGALDNLAQLLQPQLVALFSRYTLHSCSAASLHPSPGSSNIRHRSVHSALRMRLASTSNFTERDLSSPDVHSKEETVSKVLDISTGAAQAVLEPPKCLEILEALSIFQPKNEDDDNKAVVKHDETPTPANENVVSSTGTITQSDIKLITVSKVHILLPGLRADSGQDSVGVSSRGGLHVIGSDFVWLGSFYPGSSKNRLQLGALTAHLERAQNDSTVSPLVEALGFELLTTESSADAGDNDGLFVSLIKLKINFSLSVAHDAATVINRVASPLGYPIAWEPMHLASQRLQTSFQIEACRTGFSRTISNRPRLVMAERQSLGGEIASVSLTLKRTKSKISILQGGVAPMTIRGTEASSLFFTFGISQEKSSACRCCLTSLKEITARLPARKDSTPALEWSENDEKEGDSANSVPTGWSFTVDLKVAGGDIRVNEALQLKLLLLSVSSVEKDTGSLHPVKAGGELKLVFATKGATLCASKSGTLAGLKDSMVLRIEDVGVSVDFSHGHIDCRHNYVVDATLHLLYLLKLPFIESEAQSRKSPAIEASHSQTSGKREEDSGVASRCQWHWRLGAQLDRADFSCTADIYHRSSHRRRQIRAVVHGKVLNFGVAARIGNYHPTKNHLQPSARNQFTDIQVSVGDIQVVERLQNAWGEIRTGFGDFSCLPEHAFMGILVCLDLPELKCLSETFRVSNASMIDQQSLPSAMLSWHLTSSIAKMFQELNAAWLRREAARKQPIAEIPLIVTWNDPALAKTVNAFPLLSGFYRNYSEAGLPCHVIAGSMENVDIAVTTSSLYCLASVLNVRAGKISGFVADLEINPEVPTPKSVLDVVGPFEEYIGCVAGYSARFVNVETFWSPLNVTCSVTEESLTNAEGSNTGVKTAASIGLTKLRLDLHKPLFDVLVTRVAGVTRGIESLRRSITAASPVKLTPIQLTKSPELFTGFERKCQREVAFSCDGIEINVIEMSGSTHIRVGSIMLGHNSSTLSGSASIQNLAVGHRTTENPISKTVEIEEVVFGANTEPSLWQLAVENYPEKLIAARWSFGDRSEGTLFLDVQAYQLHVSHHFIQALAKFSRIEPDLSLFGPWEQKADESSGQPMDCKPFVLQQRWNIKVLVAPSVMSYWRQNATNKGKSGVWMTSGQLFASVAVGTDEVAQQSLSTYGPAVHDIDRFVAVPTLEMMLNMDKFGVNTSDDLPPLEVHFQRDSVGPVPTHTSSTWQRFSKYISGVSEAQRLLHDCSVRVTGDQHQMLERVAIGEAQVCLLYTDMARTNIQAEVNALCVKLSSFSLGAIQSLLSGGSGKRLDHSSEDSFDERYASEIITQRSIAANNFDGSSTDDFKNLRRMAEGRRPLPGELVFTESLLIETQSVVSGCSAPLLTLKFRFRLTRTNSILSFLTWQFSWKTATSLGKLKGMNEWRTVSLHGLNRLCDIRCQLRCWNSKKSCFAVVCEFYVPWDDALANGGSDELEGANEPGSFGDLMSQWFDDDMEETRYRARLLEFGARTRTYKFENELPSDNWELRWRAPLQSEQEPEVRIHRSHENPECTSIFCATSVPGQYDSATDRIGYPRTTIDAMVEASSKGIEVSTLVGPVSMYLNQTAMLVISAIPKLLQTDPKQSPTITGNADERMSSMRIRVVNHTGVDIWYRQEGTTECLLLSADASSAYSWLSLASNPFYQLCFAMDDPREKLIGKTQTDSVQPEQEDPPWCDPCRIKENGVTGRYFGGHGFVWICVELSGLKTTVTLRSSLTVRNYCKFPVRVKVNKNGVEHGCARSEELYRDAPTIRRRAYYHPNCVSLDGSACTLSTSAKSDGSVARIMAESVTTVSFGIDGGSWSNVETQGRIPSEFDLVKISDNEAEFFKKAQCKFTVLHPKSPDEHTQYAWAKVTRVQCKTVLPTDFDPLQPHLSGRYTWMEMSLWPAITVENVMDIPLTTINLEVSPASEKSLSTINPFEPVDAQLQYGQGSSSANTSSKPMEFLLQCSSAEDSKEQIFVFEGCKVVVSFCNDHRPMIRIRTERILSVANMTPSDLIINIGSPLGNHGGALERIGSCVERSIGFTVVSNRLAVTIAAVEDLSSASDHIEWSPEVSLNVKGDTKPIVVLRSLASAYCIELVNSDGYLKLTIRPQVVVINSTVVSGCNAGWSVPVCLHKEAKKRSITADVSSWLSSKLSRRPSEDPSNSAKHALVARLSCSFRVSLVEDGYEWTEELAVLLPKISFLLSSDGKLRIAEPETSSSPTTNTQEGLYPAPSTTTYRRRLLIRHRGFRHKMLTYTMTQEGKSIHIMFFVDHQPPVIIHNQWGNMLGFRNVSFPSDPEGVGANFYLEYDWSLQFSAKHRKSIAEKSDTDDKEPNSESKLLSDWLEASSQSLVSADTPDTTTSERMRFQIGSPQFGWSNSLWQVGGIQFASFTKEEGSATAQPGPTFLVMCFYRAGSWLISITCLEDPMDGLANPTPSLVLPSVASPVKAEQTVPAFLKVGVVVEELSLHFCDEHDPLRDARGMILYPEILRATCNAVSMVFATAPDPPEVSRHSTRLGYLSHIRSYTTLLVAAEDIEMGHFLQTCNFPVILHFPETHPSKNLLQFDRVKKHESLGKLMDKLLDKQLPGAEKACLITRVVYTDTWDPIGIPSYFHSIELKLSPAVLQVEDDILAYVNAFVRPILAAQEGEAVLRAMHENERRKIAPSVDAWSLHAYESAKVTAQRKVYVEWLEISNLQVTITARVSIPVLNSFDGTPLHFGSTEMREVFSFPDQLIKDLAADYVADTIVRSPVLLMSLNIIGNPANGYSPWILTKGVVGGVASFLGHTTAATLTSVSGFSYSISRTMDQLTLPPDQLRKRHYTRPTHLSSALADGLGSLGSSVVGAAAGVITTPIAVYKERQMQGLNTGIRNVVGGVGMGLVGIVARPMGGVASLVSMASDGLLYGMGGSRTPFDDSVSRFDARPNELLRYKLKVLPDAIGSSLIFAHGQYGCTVFVLLSGVSTHGLMIWKMHGKLLDESSTLRFLLSEFNLRPLKQKSQMEAGEGANASLPSAESNGEGLFRLLKFVRETQCEMEVVKPVLDELEVMRMCRSFGMMSSVNPKDFDFNVLHAREFDDDFVRFLRFELFENACPGDVKLKGLFGKQAQVADALVDLKACSIGTVASLAGATKGIYCLFEPKELRDTPAFVLRFLTGLTPDIICSTSPSDLEQVATAMTTSDEQEDDELSSYSDEMNAAWEAQEKKEQQDYALAAQQLKEEIANQRAIVDQVSNELFQLRGSDTANSARDTSLQTALSVYESFREWIRSTCLRKIDRKIQLTLDAPNCLRKVEAKLFAVYSCGDVGELGKLLEMCATTPRPDLVKAVNNRKAKTPKPEVSIEASETTWKSFMEKVSEPLIKLRIKWWIAVESVLAATNEVRSAVKICTGKERMCVKFIYFPPSTDSRRPSRANEKVIRTLGKFASLCDYDARNRIMTFLSEDSVGIYKFDESFKKMERMKVVDLGVRSTLAELPFRDVLLLDSTVYVTDSSGRSQGIDIHNDQTSNVMNVHDGAETSLSCSRLLELADNLAIGVVSRVASDDGAFEGVLKCISRDDHRHLPDLRLGVKFLTDRVNVQCVDDEVLVLDPLAQKVYFFSVRVTVRSDSYRMRQSDNGGSKASESDSSNADCPRKQHWMYAFYHVFEKFPVRGLLDVGVPSPVSILVACPGVEETNAALENYHDFLSLLMSDLMALNKPLHGLDLTSGLKVQRSLAGVTMKSKPLKSLFQTLITFLPVQICRAEGNALTVLHDGMDQSLEPEDEIQAWEQQISQSRFGLGSYLLCYAPGEVAVCQSKRSPRFLSEFQRKFQKLLTVNRDRNFLTEMYSGKLKINCSPPLGTLGYYDSLRHARQLIETLVNDPDLSSRGFKSGSSYHDCIRLVLAKISILDWTAVDESSQRLEMNELHRKLPGAIRTGCLIPAEAQTKNESLPRSLKDPLLHDKSLLCMLGLGQLCRDYPEFSECWAIVNQEVTLDEMDDEDVDFGPSACFQANAGTSSIHFTLQNLFQRYLALTAKGPLEKIVGKDYANFDAIVSFLVCRRKTKVILWVKQLLGTERFMDEWEQIEQTYILPFEALFRRCLHSCAKCQLQCMRSACHSFDEDHDCGMSHTCRGLCEYCALNYRPGKEMPRCVGQAGHEGKCDCVKGDHTCGAECSLIGASNCGGLCVLIGGHDGDHRCSVKQHACGAACSATKCRGKCILNTEHRHTMHKCAETQCKHACEMNGCKEWCSTANHFHDQLELGVKFAEENGQRSGTEPSLLGKIVHLCNSRHTCNAPCKMEGICARSVQVSMSKFAGSCDTFDYELKQMWPPLCLFSRVYNWQGAPCVRVGLLRVDARDPWEELVSGVRGYLQSRLAAGVTQDIVSVVTFGNQGIIEFEGVPIRTAPNRSIDFHGGGTFYSNGLNQANAIFSRTNLSVYKPVMIFFTDGRPADRKKGPALAVDVRNRFAKFGLRTFVVGYGRASDMGLEDLAEKLGGSVHEALTTADLREANFHIEMNPSDVGNNDRLVVQEVLKEIAQYHLADTNSQRPFKVVLLMEVDRLSKNAQHALRRTMEKYTATCRLILCCNNPSKVIDPLRSRCLGVRVGAPRLTISAPSSRVFAARKDSTIAPRWARRSPSRASGISDARCSCLRRVVCRSTRHLPGIHSIMWQVAVLARFEVLQNFLSADEREWVKSALFERRGQAPQVNAEISEHKAEEDATAATNNEAESAHLERPHGGQQGRDDAPSSPHYRAPLHTAASALAMTFVDFEKCSSPRNPRTSRNSARYDDHLRQQQKEGLTGVYLLCVFAVPELATDGCATGNTILPLQWRLQLSDLPTCHFMTPRNTRYWRSFLHNLLCPPDGPSSETAYDGVCVFTLSGRVEYRDGCFRASSSPSDASLEVDPLQFLAIFHQLTCQAIQEERDDHQEPGVAKHPIPNVTPALRLGDCVFHIVSATFSSICAVARGKSRGLVAEKLPFGVLVVAFSPPLTLETVFGRIVRALTPIATTFKTDRAGVGVQSTADQARVTHFPAHDEQQARIAADGRSEAQRIQDRLARKRKQTNSILLDSQRRRGGYRNRRSNEETELSATSCTRKDWKDMRSFCDKPGVDQDAAVSVLLDIYTRLLTE
ncbi:P-loop containing nucleoside triphosphate hydrolase [Phytophthora cactorum]|nr:P-loop containing nucleoside triphosphate hydrolase [Phytophthora cactorum]